MESKLPLSDGNDAEDDYPRGVNVHLTPIEKLIFAGLLAFSGALACTLFACLYVVCRFIWMLALRA
jgi:hypothetical protein